MSKITRTGSGEFRPSWTFPAQGSIECQQLEMMESIRNVCEQVRDEIRGIRSCSSVHRAFLDLDHIRRNTAPKKRKRTKGAK